MSRVRFLRWHNRNEYTCWLVIYADRLPPGQFLLEVKVHG